MCKYNELQHLEAFQTRRGWVWGHSLTIDHRSKITYQCVCSQDLASYAIFKCCSKLFCCHPLSFHHFILYDVLMLMSHRFAFIACILVEWMNKVCWGLFSGRLIHIWCSIEFLVPHTLGLLCFWQLERRLLSVSLQEPVSRALTVTCQNRVSPAALLWFTAQTANTVKCWCYRRIPRGSGWSRPTGNYMSSLAGQVGARVLLSKRSV